MTEHVSFVLVVLTTILLGSINDSISCGRDWCGFITTLPGLLLARLPAVAALLLLYLHFAHFIELPLLRHIAAQYLTLLYVVAAVVAEVTVHLLLRHEKFGSPLPLPLNKIITRRKVWVADRLENNPNANRILTDALRTCRDLTNRRRAVEIRSITNPPSRDQIFHVIDIVGLAHFMTIAKTLKNP